MPTPHISIDLTTIRLHQSCPPEFNTIQPHEARNLTESITRVDQGIIDEHVEDKPASSVKVGLDGSEEDGFTFESVASRNATIEPEVKAGDQYSYSMPKDLGFALTWETAITFTDMSALRKRPSYSSSFLRPGSKFVGTQTDKEVYNVEVQIKQVDMRQSTVCGYLKIDGLTQDFPSLTTFFDGEIVGPHYSFITKHADWGASEKSDLAHWDRFPAFRPLAKQAKNPEFYPKNISQRENIFMRWKERFLVPDHRVNEIQGASYEGFYYICFNQIQGTISGVYFHAKSDRYQSLDLTHIPNRGCLAAIEWA